ncbi:MAG: hypothetical protein KJ893_06110 [Candidatus Omnitrophica bacterium]|nr:hypothetical protein [Candidatus Omnitrophota bacterium]MBU4478618.1 hypothetical protein [Candidatus Omnitrophota bacterium]
MRQKLQKIFSCILIQVFLLLPAHCFAADKRDMLAPYLNITRTSLKAAFTDQEMDIVVLLKNPFCWAGFSDIKISLIACGC